MIVQHVGHKGQTQWKKQNPEGNAASALFPLPIPAGVEVKVYAQGSLKLWELGQVISKVQFS